MVVITTTEPIERFLTDPSDWRRQHAPLLWTRRKGSASSGRSRRKGHPSGSAASPGGQWSQHTGSEHPGAGLVGRVMERRAFPAVSQTAAQRDPAIDLVRFTCLLLVVAAHCMMVSPVLRRDGTVETRNVLMEQGWFTPVLWVLMIVPLFFVLGGVTGLQSWRR